MKVPFFKFNPRSNLARVLGRACQFYNNSNLLVRRCGFLIVKNFTAPGLAHNRYTMADGRTMPERPRISDARREAMVGIQRILNGPAVSGNAAPPPGNEPAAHISGTPPLFLRGTAAHIF